MGEIETGDLVRVTYVGTVTAQVGDFIGVQTPDGLIHWAGQDAVEAERASVS